VDALGNYGKASMPEQGNPPNPWRKIIIIIIIIIMNYSFLNFSQSTTTKKYQRKKEHCLVFYFSM